MPIKKKQTKKEIVPPKEPQKQGRKSTSVPHQTKIDKFVKPTREDFPDFGDESSSELQVPSTSPNNRRSVSEKTQPKQRRITHQQAKAEIRETIRQKAQRRFRPGIKALRDIKRYQQVQGLMCRRLPFQRLVRHVADCQVEQKVVDKSFDDFFQYKFSSKSMLYIQTLVEDYMTTLFEDAQLCAIHARRVTVQEKDMMLARRIRGLSDPGFYKQYM